jgi:hypothetical protein
LSDFLLLRQDIVAAEEGQAATWWEFAAERGKSRGFTCAEAGGGEGEEKMSEQTSGRKKKG